MEWLKKHWEILAASAAGILVLYWLYQTYQSDQTANAQAAQDTTANADALAAAQQLANADYGGYYDGSSGGGTSTGSTIATTTPVSNPSTTPTPVPTPQTPANTSPGGTGYPVTETTVTSGGPQLAGYTFNGVALVADNPTPDSTDTTTPTASTASNAVAALFGSTGGGNNDTAQAVIQPIAPDLTHISDGSIPMHGTAIPKTPSPVEMSSLGGR